MPAEAERPAPTPAGRPLTAQRSGEVCAGILRAMGWQRAGRSDAKQHILAPPVGDPAEPDTGRRVVISGWTVSVQSRLADRGWVTDRRIGALAVIRGISERASALWVFFEDPADDEPGDREVDPLVGLEQPILLDGDEDIAL